MSNHAPLCFVSGISLATALFLSACGKAEKAPEPDPPRPVITITVPAKEEQVRRTFSGLVDSVEGTGIAFEVGGRVIEVIAKEGTTYKKDDTLARLDSSELENQLNATRARQTEAQQSLRRTQQLFETGNASRSQLEAAIAAEQSAATNFKSAEKRVEDSVLKMPYDGVIGSVPVEAQMVVSAGQTAVTIQGEGGMEFEIGVPARSIDDIAVGQKCVVTLGGIPGEEFPAKVDTISPQVAENTTYPVKLLIESEDPRVREGLDGEATIFFPNPDGNSVTIPSACIATTPESKNFVWVVSPTGNGLATVKQTMVEVGELRPNGSIAILSGLTPGQIVVSRGVHSLEPDQEVRLSSPKAQ